MENVFIRSLTHHIEKLNLYILPKYIWLALLYFLSINTVLNLFLRATKTDPTFPKFIPEEANKVNDIIMTHLEKWIPFVLFLCIAFVISGFTITFLKFVNINIRDVEYGLYIGFWLFIIVATFEFYIILGSFFLLLIPFTALVKYSLSRLMLKYNISFG